MGLTLTVRYRGAADLAAHLEEHATQGAMLLRTAGEVPLEGLSQFDTVTLVLVLEAARAEVEAEVLQIIAGLGLALRLLRPPLAAQLCGGAEPARSAEAPEVAAGPPDDDGDIDADADEEDEEEDDGAPGRRTVRGPVVPRGMGPASWPIEKLLSEWNTLSLADKVKVARRGKRAARGMILKGTDKKLHHMVLKNPEITPQEVAAMVGMSSLEPALLQRIAGSPEWTRHTDVARALVCHPKMSSPQVQRLMHQLPEAELRRLARTGRVRASVKRMIVKYLDSGGRGRRR